MINMRQTGPPRPDLDEDRGPIPIYHEPTTFRFKNKLVPTEDHTTVLSIGVDFQKFTAVKPIKAEHAEYVSHATEKGSLSIGEYIRYGDRGDKTGSYKFGMVYEIQMRQNETIAKVRVLERAVDMLMAGTFDFEKPTQDSYSRHLVITAFTEDVRVPDIISKVTLMHVNDFEKLWPRSKNVEMVTNTEGYKSLLLVKPIPHVYYARYRAEPGARSFEDLKRSDLVFLAGARLAALETHVRVLLGRRIRALLSAKHNAPRRITWKKVPGQAAPEPVIGNLFAYCIKNVPRKLPSSYSYQKA
jgi:hypothetical protein